jgi:UTP--glucose-1-phosphate uridylyltransferase
MEAFHTMLKVRKAVIPAAGLGTRFLPATKTIPKEMLPLVDKPTLLYIVEEIVSAGFEEIVFIEGRGKTAIIDFFDTSYEIEDVLEKSGRLDLLRDVIDLRRKIRVLSIRQHKALGLGHAVLTAQPAIGKEPFAVLLGDEVMFSLPGKPSGIAQLKKIYEETGKSTVAVMKVPESEVSKYGIIAPREKGENLWFVDEVVEKPQPDQAPSHLALPGRYVFDPEIFEDLRQTKPGRGGEIQLTDGMTALARRKGMLATLIEAKRFDAGDKLGYILANIEVALKHPEIGKALDEHLRERFRE